MKAYENAYLCLGIDPNPRDNESFDEFKNCFYRHLEFIEFYKKSLADKVLKLQLSFFLSYGSKGIELLEELVDRYQSDFIIILDGKFNDVSNSLKGYLKFVFRTLGIHGVTLNPFLGESTLQMAFEMCAQNMGARGRVFVLCVTSERSTGTLSYLQENWISKLMACVQVRNSLFGYDETLRKLAGVVIGAKHESILFSKELKESGLSVLVPGLGAQGGNWEIIPKCHFLPNTEFVFPISRSLFDGGNLSLAQMQENMASVRRHF